MAFNAMQPKMTCSSVILHRRTNAIRYLREKFSDQLSSECEAATVSARLQGPWRVRTSPDSSKAVTRRGGYPISFSFDGCESCLSGFLVQISVCWLS